jgi:hypothetical protein
MEHIWLTEICEYSDFCDEKHLASAEAKGKSQSGDWVGPIQVVAYELVRLH